MVLGLLTAFRTLASHQATAINPATAAGFTTRGTPGATQVTAYTPAPNYFIQSGGHMPALRQAIYMPNDPVTKQIAGAGYTNPNGTFTLSDGRVVEANTMIGNQQQAAYGQQFQFGDPRHFGPSLVGYDVAKSGTKVYTDPYRKVQNPTGGTGTTQTGTTSADSTATNGSTNPAAGDAAQVKVQAQQNSTSRMAQARQRPAASTLVTGGEAFGTGSGGGRKTFGG